MNVGVRTAILPLLGLALLATPGRAANLLVNGSFEDGAFVPDGNGAMSLFPSSTTMTGWTVISNELAWIKSGSFGVTAPDGDKFLDLAGYHDSAPYGGVEQSIATGVGSVYLLEFEIGTFDSAGVAKSVFASAGDASATLSGISTSFASEWHYVSLQFTAIAAATQISLVGTGSGGTYIGLDNVSVTLIRAAVPEPSTAVLAAFGLAAIAGFGGVRRFRTSR